MENERIFAWRIVERRKQERAVGYCLRDYRYEKRILGVSSHKLLQTGDP